MGCLKIIEKPRMVVLRSGAQAFTHGMAQSALSLMSGDQVGFSSFAAGVLSSFASSGLARMGGNVGSFSKTLGGNMITGFTMGGIGAAATGGNFWDGASVGLVVAIFNEAMHGGPGDGDQTEKNPEQLAGVTVRAVRKSSIMNNWRLKLTGLALARGLGNMRNVASFPERLHNMFDAVEEVGAWTEISGVVGAPFTQGGTLALEPIGFWEGAIGTAGNVGVDLYESYSTRDTKYLKTAAFRITKFGVTAGLGKAIDKIPGGSYMIDKTVLKINAFIYDKVVSPKMEAMLKF